MRLDDMRVGDMASATVQNWVAIPKSRIEAAAALEGRDMPNMCVRHHFDALGQWDREDYTSKKNRGVYETLKIY